MIEYKGYTIKILLLNDTLFFPQILLKGKWIHEFMCSWKRKEDAIEAAKVFIDQCDGTPTTDERLFAAGIALLESHMNKKPWYQFW